MVMRQRKLKSEDDETYSTDSPSWAKKNHEKSGRKYSITIIILSVLFLGYIAIASDLRPVRIGSKAIDSLAFSFNLQKPFYVVIIDAGSTGSRVLAFSFHESIINSNLILDNELFYEIKPGLSSFADNPKNAAKSLLTLLDKAKEVIPKSEWAHTPLSMKATAGLRLLPEQKANNILAECKNLFDTSGFLANKNSISIMDGTDEGIFSWFTVNFLLDRFNAQNTANTVAALDLGGGSTQVTFSPNKAQARILEKNIYYISTFNQNMSLYTQSYLGMGLMAARNKILIHNVNLEETNNAQEIILHSECVNPIVSAKWNYGGNNYLIKGPVNATYKIVKSQNYAGSDEKLPIVKFSECLKTIQQYVDTLSNKPVGLKDHEIYAFSYYFERATETGLIEPFHGGVVTLNDFLKQAKEACDYPNTDQPFMCLDLTFIYTLLHKGFGLESSTKLYLYKKITGHELSWALGAAFNILQNGL